MVKMVKDLKWNIEYLWDKEKKEPYKNLCCFHSDGTSSVERFYYEYNEYFSEPYEVKTELDELLNKMQHKMSVLK